MVEGYAHEGASLKITTVQNWSRDIVNFNNKRAVAEAGAHVQWVEGSIGSKTTYTFPSTILKGEGASTEIYGITAANGGLWKENGAKVWHLAPDTRSRVVNKSISARGGTSVYRGMVYVAKGAKNARSHVQCDGLGDERVGRLLGAAAKALVTGNFEADRGDLNLFADCLGWLVSPDKMLDDTARAAAVLVSFTGALNRWLESLAGSQEAF